MLNEYDILRMIRQAAVEAVTQMDLSEVYYGEVAEADEGEVSKIRIDEKWLIEDDQIIVPHKYKEKTLKDVKIKHHVFADVRALQRLHEIEPPELDEGCEEDEILADITIKDFIKTGDKVVLQREQGGQKFVIEHRSKTEEE